MLVFRAGIHKILVGVANRKDPDQTASSNPGLHNCLGPLSGGIYLFAFFNQSIFLFLLFISVLCILHL